MNNRFQVGVIEVEDTARRTVDERSISDRLMARSTDRDADPV
jgi:hypothetical protein